jgi:glycerol-3-phosphate dehydrogenase
LDLGRKLGAEEKTFFGVSLEDFWLSGLGKESRNWQFGNQFSKNKQRGRFNPRGQISAVSAKLRRRKYRSVLEDLRDVYEGIIVAGVADGIHDALDSPLIVGRKVRDAIFNTISRVPFPEASEGTFAVPSLLQRAKVEGMTLPIVEGLHSILFGGASSRVTMRRILEFVESIEDSKDINNIPVGKF